MPIVYETVAAKGSRDCGTMSFVSMFKSLRVIMDSYAHRSWDRAWLEAAAVAAAQLRRPFDAEPALLPPPASARHATRASTVWST